MKLSPKNRMFTAFCVSFSLLQLARADMGTVWVEEVKADSITINWSDPSGIHRLDQGAQEFRVSWELVRQYPEDSPEGSTLPEDRYPRSTGGNVKYLHRAADRPFAISGLLPNTSYRIKVETQAEKRVGIGDWRNPIYRQVAMVKQRTLAVAKTQNLRIVGAGGDSLTLQFKNSEWRNYPTIRIAYKKKGTPDLVHEVAVDAFLPYSRWRDEEGMPSGAAQHGFADRLTAETVNVTFSGLSADERYEVVAYGFKTGNPSGVHLGSVTAETSGYRPLETVPSALAADHHYLLEAYGRELRQQCQRSVIDSVTDPEGDSGVTLEEASMIFADEKESLDNDLAVLVFLISSRREGFDAWQANLSGGCPSLMDFASRVFPDTLHVCETETDLVPIRFVRGDVNTDGLVDIADSIETFDHLFRSKRIFCRDAADSNDDGVLDISDPIHLLDFLFREGDAPPAPSGSCGDDPTADDLECAEFNSCG